MINPAPYDVINNNHSIRITAYLSTLVPSPLDLPIYGENNSSVLDDNVTICPGRHLHTTVYDPLSDSLWIFGGRESSGKLCDSGLAVVDLSLALAGSVGNDSNEMTSGDGDGVEEGEGGGLVRWVVSSGDAPTGRLFHAAALLPVSEHSVHVHVLLLCSLNSSTRNLKNSFYPGLLSLLPLSRPCLALKSRNGT